MQINPNNIAPVTREGAIGAFKLLMIVLAAAIFWQAAASVNAEMHARDLVTAPPFLRGASKLLVGTETSAPIQERLVEFWNLNHRLIAQVAMLIGVSLLVARYLLFGRVFDFIYLESPAREKRAYSGFLANIFLMLAHTGAMYAAVLFSRAEHASLVPIAVLALLGFNILWIMGILITARRVERRSMRGVWLLGFTTLAAGVVLAYGTWIIEATSVFGTAMSGSALICVTSGTAMLLCIVDAILQARVYRSPIQRPVA